MWQAESKTGARNHLYCFHLANFLQAQTRGDTLMAAPYHFDITSLKSNIFMIRTKLLAKYCNETIDPMGRIDYNGTNEQRESFHALWIVDQC